MTVAHITATRSPPNPYTTLMDSTWGGDKALKGMRRRYTNFTDAMLIHCKRFPNCGMYGVDARRGGLA